VPLWLALLLKRQRRARIIPPDWMNYEALQALLKEEEEEQGRFSALPFQWLEVSAAVLERYSCIYIVDVVRVTTLLNQI
jgi:GINS complex subunit 2